MDLSAAIAALTEKIGEMQRAKENLEKLQIEFPAWDNSGVVAPVKTVSHQPSGKKPAKKAAVCSTGKKKCNKCGVIKPLDDFSTHRECKDGHIGYCRKCQAEQAKKRYHEKMNTSIPASNRNQKAADTPKPAATIVTPERKHRCEICQCNFVDDRALALHNHQYHPPKS